MTDLIVVWGYVEGRSKHGGSMPVMAAVFDAISIMPIDADTTPSTEASVQDDDIGIAEFKAVGKDCWLKIGHDPDPVAVAGQCRFLEAGERIYLSVGNGDKVSVIEAT